MLPAKAKLRSPTATAEKGFLTSKGKVQVRLQTHFYSVSYWYKKSLVCLQANLRPPIGEDIFPVYSLQQNAPLNVRRRHNMVAQKP